MHRVFLIQELMQQILENFLPDFDILTLFVGCSEDRLPALVPDAEARRSLLHVALTCHAFKESALDVLWWAMDDLSPLFSLLSGYKALDNGTTIITGPIPDSDCNVFFDYAKRVKLYRFQESHEISLSSYLQILGAGNRNCILPCLRYFICERSSPEILFFVSPPLRIVVANTLFLIEGDPPPMDLWGFVNSLSQKSEGLLGLNLAYPMSDNCLKSISRIRNLKYLHVHNSPQDLHTEEFMAIKAADVQELYLSSGFTLSHLSFEGCIALLLASFQMPPTCLFTALKNLTLSCDYNDIMEMTALFRLATFPRLQRLELILPAKAGFNGSEITTWNDFSKSLVGSTTAQFHSFSVKKRGGANPGARLPFASIPHVLELHLTSFDMYSLASLTISDVRSMCQAWPHLYELHLKEPIGFAVLVELAICLPGLLRLEVNLDFEDYPGIDDIPILTHSLSSLEIMSHKAMRDPVRLALCIDRLFPNLQHFPHPVQYVGDQWNEGFTILRTLQRIRLDQEVKINALAG